MSDNLDKLEEALMGAVTAGKEHLELSILDGIDLREHIRQLEGEQCQDT